MPGEVRILAAVLNTLREFASQNPGDECCGLLAGSDGVISKAFSAPNAAANPATSYEIAPENVFHLMRQMRSSGLQMMGIYHSHPRGKNEPSARDIEQAYYPGAVYFILSPPGNSPRPVRAFSIREGVPEELQIHEI